MDTIMKGNGNKINYGKLVDRAMHMIVFQVLKSLEKNGLIGDHHFFVSFLTKAKGVRVPSYLIDKYPEEMTIVLQYQYRDLQVNEKGFSVTLTFSGKQENIYVPLSAVTTFADPSVQFGLQCNASFEADSSEVDLLPLFTESMGKTLKKEAKEEKGEEGLDNLISFVEYISKKKIK